MMALVLTGSGTLAGMLSKPDLNLRFDIQQGSMKLTASRLRILPGGRIEAHYAPPVAPDVTVDFQAQTSALASNPFGQAQQYEITVTVTGPVTNMKISLSSLPADLTREQMLAALGHLPGVYTSQEGEFQRELGAVLTAAATSTVFAPIENIFVEKLGFEQFTLQSQRPGSAFDISIAQAGRQHLRVLLSVPHLHPDHRVSEALGGKVQLQVEEVVSV